MRAKLQEISNKNLLLCVLVFFLHADLTNGHYNRTDQGYPFYLYI